MAKKSAEFADLQAMDATRLGRELEDVHRQLFTLRLQVATRQLQNVKEINKTKKRIARIRTLQRQRELAALGGGE